MKSERIKRQSGELQEKFIQQLKLLELANNNYDNGIEFSALNIAITLRILLYDKNSSKSLFNQLNIKNIQFLDTSHNDHPGTYLGLIVKTFSGVIDGIGGEILYKPTFTSEYHSNKKKWMNFDEWWSKKILVNENGHFLDRMKLITIVANQEGGAHIDPEIDEIYDKFRHSHSGGLKIIGSKSRIERDFDNTPIFPSLRQVSYELIESIKNAKLM